MDPDDKQGGRRFGQMRARQEDKLDAVNKDILQDEDLKRVESLGDRLEVFKNMFMEFDEDNSGDIDFTELKLMLEKLGRPRTHLDAKQLLSDLRKGTAGTINYREFVDMMLGNCLTLSIVFPDEKYLTLRWGTTKNKKLARALSNDGNKQQQKSKSKASSSEPPNVKQDGEKNNNIKKPDKTDRSSRGSSDDGDSEKLTLCGLSPVVVFDDDDDDESDEEGGRQLLAGSYGDTSKGRSSTTANNAQEPDNLWIDVNGSKFGHHVTHISVQEDEEGSGKSSPNKSNRSAPVKGKVKVLIRQNSDQI